MAQQDRLERPGSAGVSSFEAFYRAERSGALAVVLALRGQQVHAEEVVQEAFLRAFRRWDEVAAMDRPDLWLHTVALNLATSRVRRLASETRALARVVGRRQPELSVRQQPTEEFWALVRRLPPRQARAVSLRYAADMPISDIAAVLGCAQGTVGSHLHAARQTLAQRLGEDLS